MTNRNAGLQLRLRRAKRQIGIQHEHLRSLYVSLADCIAKGRTAQVQDVARQLLGAMEAHFSLEDGVFFPAVYGLHPDRARDLNELMREHEKYRSLLVRLCEDLTAGGLEAFAKGYQEFSASIADHEDREERLIDLLTEEPSDE